MIVNYHYLAQMKIALRSIINRTTEEITVYLINSELSEKEIHEIEEIIDIEKDILVDVKVPDSIITDLKVDKKFRKENFYKLLIPQLLPDELEKVLYIDVDIIAKKDISEIFNINLGNYLYAAVEDYMVNSKMKDYIKELGFCDSEKYINTGVLLINLKELRKYNYLVEYVEYINKEIGNFKFFDQQVINAFHHGKFLVIEEKYNLIPQYKNAVDFIKYHIRVDKEPVIIHYAGMKPWFPYYFGKYYCEFWKYAGNSIEIDVNRKGSKNTVIKIPICMVNRIKRRQYVIR